MPAPMLLSLRSTLRPTLTLALLLLAAVTPARALLNIDGTRNQLFVFGGITYTHTSNLFAEASGRGDYYVTAHVGAELQRRAGIIAVNSTAKIDFVRYGEYQDENTINPNFSITFSKSGGRTTGTLSVNIYRETRSDSAVNLRTSSWNFPVALTLRYPINEKFYATSATGYLSRSYTEDQSLVDYSDFSQAVDLYYVYTSKLDLLAGYRIRVSDTALDGRTIDHWFNVGATGALFSKMTGSLRFGYQFRNIQRAGAGRFNHVNASASISWPITRKVMLDLQLNRDFNTIATGATVDSTSAALHSTYGFSRRTDFHATLSAGRNDFLEQGGAGRLDTFFSAEAGVRYRMNDHLQMGASYVFLRNWSDFNQSDYDSHGFTLDVSSRY